MKLIRKLDIFIILILLLASFIPNLIYLTSHDNTYKHIYAKISVNGELLDTIDLSNQTISTLTINCDLGSNTIYLSNNSVYISHADCPDHLCVKQGAISKVGETIICLPHKLIIELKGDKDDSSSDMILSH